MGYCNVNELSTYTGFSPSDFKVNGKEMTEAEWNDFLDLIISNAYQKINRYCNVTSFETTTVTEYHDGRGSTGDFGAYRDFDKTFYLRESPVQSVTSLSINNQSPSVSPVWVDLTEVSALADGDFIVNKNYELGKIIIVSGNVPVEGYNNVKIVYVSGYPTSSDEYKDIKMANILVAQNLLLQKKKVQEATTLRATGARDMSEMFALFNESYVLTNEIKNTLDRYKRRQVDMSLYQ